MEKNSTDSYIGDNSHLTVYKASAGSGKTFRLAVRYIVMLVNSPENYRHILAVTFTNKATAEMKQRIMSQLYGIGHCLKSSDGYYQEVKKAVRYDESTIRRNALQALDNILQDYGRFRVETIDSFFQTVLRGLARELNIGGNLTLELDIDTAIDEAVDAFLAGVEPNSPEKRNVMKFVENNIENDRSWSIDKTLKAFSKELFSEIFMENGRELRRIMTENPDAVNDYRQNLITARDAVLPSRLEQIKETGERVRSAISASGSTVDDISRYPRDVLFKIIDGSIADIDLDKAKTLHNCAVDPDKFYSKATLKKYPQLSALAQELLSPMYAKVEELVSEYQRINNSFEAALKYMHELSLLLSIRSEIDSQSREQGRFILADTPQLLHAMEEGDTSFVYEKTGSFTRHLMIDEFQDTSDLQWSNLSLLLRECLSTGQDCLVVGDVKQSIYRWRNSDWNILNTGLEREFAIYHPDVVPMDRNFRSRQQVIDFNNTLFPKAVEFLSQRYRETTGLEYPELAQAYSGVRQECLNRDGTGYVLAEIINEKKDAEQLVETICNKVSVQLDKLMEAGVLQTDIAILCRNKNRITDIAGWFAQNRPEYSMISGEAFQLDSSVTVRIIVNALRWLSDSTDRIALAQLVWERHCALNGTGEPFDTLYARGLENCLPKLFTEQTDALRHLPLYELTEKLYTILNLDSIQGQSQYMMAFQDTVCQWLSRNPAELAQFIAEWEEKLCKTTIPAPDINGIRLLTIHKSKGLEFHTVIVPFCEWPVIDTSHEERLWVKPEGQPFDEMPFIPVAFNRSLGNSVFAEHYKREAGLQTVDNLNLLYVALTRAESNLIIIGNNPPRNYGYNTVKDVLESCLSTAPFQSEISDKGIIYETGQICPHSYRDKTDSHNPFDIRPTVQELTLRTYPINARFRQSGESARFIHSGNDDSDRQEEYIQTGKLLHNLFATIRTTADIDPQVENMLSDGLLDSKAEADKLKQQIRRHIDSTPGAGEWFSGNYALFNEASIIYRDGGVLQTRRPDRVMITPDGRAIIVDFKFGREREEYMHQVQEYMELLRKMGYNQVEGHIWYVYNNKITNC
ncbi:MAG: UvrD-helicase domain-containing protein [Bacteroidaceae bacterium]|nr:UvrD-helicase domain-containing protein [Bacteroidaceae bacterium]